MKDQKKSNKKNTSASTGKKNYGPQGVDKAPGEEVSQDNRNLQKETQKGKKVDADPTRESDKPANV